MQFRRILLLISILTLVVLGSLAVSDALRWTRQRGLAPIQNSGAELAKAAIGMRVKLPARDELGKKMPDHGILVTVDSCSACTLKSVDLRVLRSTAKQPIIIAIASPPRQLLTLVQKDSVYVLHDPGAKFIPEFLYIGSPRAATFANGSVTDVDRGVTNLNDWIKGRQA